MKCPPDVRKLIQLVTAAGWQVDYTKRGSHLMWRRPDGSVCMTTAGTPSSRRDLERIRSCLRREGVLS